MNKYLFAVIVSVYVATVTGIPVFLHYCQGELEKIEVVMKTDGCCDEDEDTEAPEGCCSDEEICIQNKADFTVKHKNSIDFLGDFQYAITNGFCFDNLKNLHTSVCCHHPDFPYQGQCIVKTTVLRI